ncbi:MAG: type VII secretion protein EssC [Oscillospiraceae bacterium]|nr:type VII secretion protein EssC [Oscillospiraceae bacterium]
MSKKQRYILTIQNSNVFKEVDVSSDTPEIKIGTLQECDVRLKHDLFNIPVLLTLAFIEDEWRVSCTGELFFASRGLPDCAETKLRHGDVIFVCSASDKSELLSLSFSYDLTVNAINFDTIIDIRNMTDFIIGDTPKAQVFLSSAFAAGEYINLSRKNSDTYVLNAANARTSATLNGIRVFDKAEVKEFDFIGIADYSFYFRNGLLYTTARSDLFLKGLNAQPLRDETPAFDYPKLNRSPRMLYAFDTSPIKILGPPEKPEKPKGNIVMSLMPAILMAAVVVITRSGMIPGLGNIGGMGFMIFSLASMGVGVLASAASLMQNRRQYKKDLADWNGDYTAYIDKKRLEIESEQQRELAERIDTYPSMKEIRDFVKTFSGRLYERCPKDTDFLHVRIGLGCVPAMRTPDFVQEEAVKTANELMVLPEQLSTQYANINDAPVMLHLRESGTVGVIGSREAQYEFFKNLLLDIMVSHHYEDVYTVIMLPQEDREKYEWIKWIPHLKESSGGMRGIVCDIEGRDHVFEHLYALLSDRNAQRAGAGVSSELPLPHYVVFVLEEYGLKTHPLFNFAENCSELGLSFIYFKPYMESLPQYCKEIVQLSGDGGVLRLREDKAYACPFTKEHINDDSIAFVSERLAPVFCEKIALSSRLTSNISLFELLNIISPENLDLIDRWSKADVQKSLAAPLGVDVKGAQLVLDLHEKAHGPHGLIAGMTGSGKSEIMQSYILSAAVNFHPYEVAFVIIDFKGGGMANQFENLPHLVGKITDIDNHEINRSLLSIRAELEKRKRLFAEFEVNHIDDYIAKFRSKVATMALPHLILIVDEFAELKAEQPEFMKELISTARVGRSLGIHLILATQKPAGQVNEQIWSNSRFKLCLKVATKEDSNEVIKSPLASEIREPGRAYLQVGNNEIFTLFQSAYSGASAVSDTSGNIREFVISEVSFTGKRSVVYERKAERTNDGEVITQLKSIIDYIDSYCVKQDIKRLPNICLPPLPEVVAYSRDRIVPLTTLINVGVYDDPGNQRQPEYGINLSEGNVMIIGSAQTGKTMLLQTILRAIAETSSPKQTAVYIVDFASKVLKIYNGLNHVGGVVTDEDDERLKNFFKLINEEINARKERFSELGLSSYEAFVEMEGAQSPSIPRIVIMVDNLTMFKDTYEIYADDMLNICREGLSLGITVIATAKQASGLSYKYFGNFSTRIALNCTESAEYGSIFDKCRILPKDIEGRGLISIDKVIYEFQAFLTYDGETESIRNEQIRALISEISEIYGAQRARAIASIPAVLTSEYWVQSNYSFGGFIVPVGLTYSGIEPVTINLADVGSIGIYGREGFGKSNLVRLLMKYLQRHVFDLQCKVYLVDGYERQLAEFENFGIVEKFTIDYADFENIVQEFSDIAELRMNMLRSGEGLEDEPLLLCVVQNPQIYTANSIAKAVSDQFKKLLADARRLKICFILSNIDNNPEYSVPEMMKHARELSQYFLFDDILEVKLFGANKWGAEVARDFRKPLPLGDGYLYDARGGVRKIKLEKSEA